MRESPWLPGRSQAAVARFLVSDDWNLVPEICGTGLDAVNLRHCECMKADA